jgi:hypothetical protein
MKYVLQVTIAVLLTAFPVQSASAQAKLIALTNADVIRLVGMRVPDQTVIAVINGAKATQLDLSPGAVSELAGNGVSTAVIAAMRQPSSPRPPAAVIAAPRQPPTPTPPATSASDPRRQEAIASLRAVQSVLAGGADTSEFKKYYLDAKIKIDALPKIPANATIREVSEIYADAVTLFIAAQMSELSADEVRSFRQKYGWIPRFFENVPDGGFGSRSTGVEKETASVWVRASAQALLAYSDQQLTDVK